MKDYFALALSASGKTMADLEQALEESLKRLREGNALAFDRNETGAFSYRVTTVGNPDED